MKRGLPNDNDIRGRDVRETHIRWNGYAQPKKETRVYVEDLIQKGEGLTVSNVPNLIDHNAVTDDNDNDSIYVVIGGTYILVHGIQIHLRRKEVEKGVRKDVGRHTDRDVNIFGNVKGTFQAKVWTEKIPSDVPLNGTHSSFLQAIYTTETESRNEVVVCPDKDIYTHVS